MYGLLIAFHIAAGTIALIAAAAALASSKGDRWHVYAGRAFTLGMVVVFLTAVAMTLIRPNLFLLLIAVFSFYLASTGWLRARNRGGEPLLAEWIASAMGVTAVTMRVRGVVDLRAGDSMGIVLLAFGGIGGSYVISDLYFLRRHRYPGDFSDRGSPLQDAGRYDRCGHGIHRGQRPARAGGPRAQPCTPSARRRLRWKWISAGSLRP